MDSKFDYQPERVNIGVNTEQMNVDTESFDDIVYAAVHRIINKRDDEVIALKLKHRKDLAAEYDRAYSDLKGILRTWLVDLNYEIFHADSSVVKPRLYAALASALAAFHEKSYQGRQKEEVDGSTRDRKAEEG